MLLRMISAGMDAPRVGTPIFHEVDLSTFTFTRLVRDAVIFVNALGYKEVACVLGHDFGAVSVLSLIRQTLIITSCSTEISSQNTDRIAVTSFKGTPSLPSSRPARPALNAS